MDNKLTATCNKKQILANEIISNLKQGLLIFYICNSFNIYSNSMYSKTHCLLKMNQESVIKLLSVCLLCS